MPIKIRIKVGSAEIEYEGPEDFFKEELPDIVSTISELQDTAGLSDNDIIATNGDALDSSKGSDSPSARRTPSFEMTTNNVAARLGVESGTDLVVAACAHLAFVRNKTNYSRKEILAEMKTAHSYFGRSHSKNLTPMLKRLITDNKLRERSKLDFSHS